MRARRLERRALRPGNVHSADGWREVREPVVSRYRNNGTRLYFRGDAAFANPDIYEFIEVEGMGYAIRLPATRVLQEKIGYLLKRPVGRPPHEMRRYYASFRYQAQSWKKPSRVGGEGRVASRRALSAVRLQLHALAYNLGNFVRTLATPAGGEPWSLTSLQEKLIKIGAKVVSYGCYVVFQMAEVAVPRQMFHDILRLIARLRAPPAPACEGP